MTQFLDEIEGHIPSLRRYARALTSNADTADDLVQDCLERAIRKKNLWRPTGALKSWLFKMLLNIHRNNIRRSRFTNHAPIDDLLVEPSIAASQPDRLALNEVASAMQKLPADQHEALLLVVLEGMSYTEAAKALQIPPGTLMSRLGRARAALRQMTGDAETPRLRTVK